MVITTTFQIQMRKVTVTILWNKIINSKLKAYTIILCKNRKLQKLSRIIRTAALETEEIKHYLREGSSCKNISSERLFLSKWNEINNIKCAF